MKSFNRYTEEITPNNFSGTDSETIRHAIRAARGTTNLVTIPRRNANGTNIWKLDEAILLPGDMIVMLNNCTIRLSDSRRDNMFRSDNVGAGIENPVWNKNIHLIGVGSLCDGSGGNEKHNGSQS